MEVRNNVFSRTSQDKKVWACLIGVFNHPDILSKHVINGQCLC